MDFLRQHRVKLAVAGAVGVGLYLSQSSKTTRKEKLPPSKPDPVATDEPPKLSEQEVSLKAFGVPLVGTGADVVDFCAGVKLCASRVEKAGTGVGYVDMYGNPTIVVTDPEYVRVILAHNVFNAHWGGITSASKAFFGDNVLFVLMGDKWRDLRNTMKFALTAKVVEHMKADMCSAAFAMTDLIQENVGQEIDLNLFCGMFHLDAVGTSAYGYDFHCLEDFKVNLSPNDIVNSFEYLLRELPRRALSPDQSVVGDYTSDNEDNKQWNKSATTVRELVKKALTVRLQELKDGQAPKNDLLGALITAYGDNSENEDELFLLIADNLVEILFAGYNTNVGTIANAAYHICQSRELYERLLEEVDDAIPDDYARGDAIDLSKLQLLRNVFYETLRVNPPAPLISRFLLEDIKLKDKFLLPQNTAVWFPAEHLHMDKASWGEDAEEFNPDRWSKSKPCPTGAFVPFSHGPRECIGKHFATAEGITALAFMLKRVEFEVAKDYKFQPVFTGFGYRPFDATTQKVCMRVIPKLRTD